MRKYPFEKAGVSEVWRWKTAMKEGVGVRRLSPWKMLNLENCQIPIISMLSWLLLHFMIKLKVL